MIEGLNNILWRRGLRRVFVGIGRIIWPGGPPPIVEGLSNSFRLPDLRRKILFTIFILLIYQLATHIPIPGVDRERLSVLFESNQSGLPGVLDLLSGGAVSRFSVIANGVYPYITASIIIQLLVPIVPWMERQVREPGGQDKQNQWTYYLAIPMAALQAYGQIQIFTQMAGAPIVPEFGDDFLLSVAIVVTMTAGTMFAIWLGELITEQGIGQGLSVIIFAGIVARAPSNFARLFGSDVAGDVVFNVVSFTLLTILTVFAIVFIQEGVRRIPVQYGKRVRGRKSYGGGRTHIPLRVNTAGMIPLIFAQSIIAFPSIVVSFLSDSGLGGALKDALGPNSAFGSQSGLFYWGVYFIMVFGFTYFYTNVMIQNQGLADNLKKQGGFILGYRPGKPTEQYINKLVNRITFVGALFLGSVAILPAIMGLISGVFISGEQQTMNPAYVITGSGLIIVVGVVLDTMRQLEAQLTMRNYRGFL